MNWKLTTNSHICIRKNRNIKSKITILVNSTKIEPLHFINKSYNYKNFFHISSTDLFLKGMDFEERKHGAEKYGI